jgi:hypothetical protein
MNTKTLPVVGTIIGAALIYSLSANKVFEIPGPARIPLSVKVLYMVFVAVLVPCYLRIYGPTNFLYFCDLALLMGLVAVWTESSLWASMPTVGILLPQTFWCVDLFGESLGFRMTGMTAYMFESRSPLFLRILSLFHVWLPYFLLWTVSRLGYDRRAFLAWTVLSSALVIVCYLLTPPPPALDDNPNQPVNVNYVYGLSNERPQQWMPALVYLGLLLIGLPALVYLPTHLALSKLFGLD